MSGIYIPGMEMPTTCFECPFMFARRYCCADLTLDLYQGDYEEIKGRVDGCPLIPIPDHGKLIDADELTKQIKRDGITSDPFVKIVCDYFNDAPTIIPADKEETE